MGSGDEGKASKSEKSSSPAPEQTNVHVYPDWAAMQAYYGPRVAVPPYFNSAVASGHGPHPYMWGPPQAMMPPYGTPYAAIYAHGGVYAHPGVPVGSHPHGNGVPPSSGGSEAMATATLAVSATPKSSGDQGLMKKLKSFDGLAMSIGNGNADSGGTDHGPSQSGETAGSSDGSNGNTSEGGQSGKKRSREGTPENNGACKTQGQNSPITVSNVNGAPEKMMGVTVAAPNGSGKVVGALVSASMSTALELRNTTNSNVKTSPTNISQPCQAVPGEVWIQNERELKRERRKQSNRESARRSRLRKQAETEELALKVQSLSAENMALKSELSKLTENSEKMKLENAKLVEKLKEAQLGNKAGLSLNDLDEKRVQLVGTADLLARVNNSGSCDRSDEDGEIYENSNSGTKLRQLLDASPRTDAVAAG